MAAQGAKASSSGAMPAATSQLQFNTTPPTNATAATASHVRRPPGANKVDRFGPPLQLRATDPVIAFMVTFRKTGEGI